MREMKLFQHYFFNFWREKSRDVLLEKDYLMDQIVENPEALYNVCDGVCFVDDEDFGSKRCEYIGFRQPVAFLYHTGGIKAEEVGPSRKGFTNEEWFEVFISGKNFPHNLAQVSSKVTKKVTVDISKLSMYDEEPLDMLDGTKQVTFYLHKVNQPLIRSESMKHHDEDGQMNLLQF